MPLSYKEGVYSFVERLFNDSGVVTLPSSTQSTSFASISSSDCLKVSRVIDGDTIVIINENNVKEKIRLYGIDAFETTLNDRLRKQAKRYNITNDEALTLGDEAREYLQKIFFLSNDNKDLCVDIVRKGIDRYNRTLGIVYYYDDNNYYGNDNDYKDYNDTSITASISNRGVNGKTNVNMELIDKGLAKRYW